MNALNLSIDELNRMVIVSLPCDQPGCFAARGERCRSLILTKRNDGYTKTPHVWRRLNFQTWKNSHPAEYGKLLEQILNQRPCETEDDTYYTMVG